MMSSQKMRGMRVQGGMWVRQLEHVALRLVSLGFSLASAHAIRWFFSPLDGSDWFQPIITWVVAIGFGVLGYFLSRGLAHRLMNKEGVWAYLPICIVVEFVEIFCNFALAASMISHASWLTAVPDFQRHALEQLTYVALSIIPLVSVLLAVVDMDMARGAQIPGGISGAQGMGQGGYTPPVRPLSNGSKPQPKPSPPLTNPGWQPSQPQPYTKGYGAQATVAAGGAQGPVPLGVTP